MSAIYKVWVQVERVDHENDDYETYDYEQVDIASFVTKDEADAFKLELETRYGEAYRVGGGAESEEFKPIATPDNPEHFC